MTVLIISTGIKYTLNVFLDMVLNVMFPVYSVFQERYCYTDNMYGLKPVSVWDITCVYTIHIVYVLPLAEVILPLVIRLIFIVCVLLISMWIRLLRKGTNTNPDMH